MKITEFNIYDEMRERETRRLNVVFHGVGEKESEEGDTGKDRAEWDKKSCGNIFAALKLDMTEEALKFCRRLGEKGENPRPLLAGFHTGMERSKLLRNARNLEKTAFKNVNVSADLTKKQRDEEKDMWKEAENRNENLSESDRSKNLQWLVVGARGEKRLVKSTPREPVGGEREWRGRRGTIRGGTIRGGTTRGSGTQRGRGLARGRGSGTGRGSGANMVPMGPDPPQHQLRNRERWIRRKQARQRRARKWKKTTAGWGRGGRGRRGTRTAGQWAPLSSAKSALPQCPEHSKKSE